MITLGAMQKMHCLSFKFQMLIGSDEIMKKKYKISVRIL